MLLGCPGQRFTTLRRRRRGRLSPVLLQLEPDFALGSQSLHDSVRRFTLEEDGGRRLHDFCRVFEGSEREDWSWAHFRF